MNTGELYSADCVGHDYLSSAKVISCNPIERADILRLRIAQEHVEAMWLGEWPAVIVLHNEKAKSAAHLYDSTYLVPPEEWDVINDAHTFLVNQGLASRFSSDRIPLIDLGRLMSPEELLKTFESTAFVFALSLKNMGQ